MRYRFKLLISQLLALVLLGVTVAGALAVLKASVAFGHNAPYNSSNNRGTTYVGWLRGYINTNNRPLVSDEYIQWSQSAIDWMKGQRNNDSYLKVAIVYHSFKADSNGQCTDASIESAWANLPGWTSVVKFACVGWPANEIRNYVNDYNALVANQTYNVQTTYIDNSTDGLNHEMTTDNYWENTRTIGGGVINKDYMAKVCYKAPANMWVPNSGSCK